MMMMPALRNLYGFIFLARWTSYAIEVRPLDDSKVYSAPPEIKQGLPFLQIEKQYH